MSGPPDGSSSSFDTIKVFTHPLYSWQEGQRWKNQCPSCILRWRKRVFVLALWKGNPHDNRRVTYYLITKRHVSLFTKEQYVGVGWRVRGYKCLQSHVNGNPTMPLLSNEAALFLHFMWLPTFTWSSYYLYIYPFTFFFLFTWVFYHFQLKPMSFFYLCGSCPLFSPLKWYKTKSYNRITNKSSCQWLLG